MKINEAVFIYFGQKAKANCDRNCAKAWGYNSRPIKHDGSFFLDVDLGTAPKNPGTYEGGVGKPESPDGFYTAGVINRWCVNECERCRISNPGEWMRPLEVLKY